MGTKRKTKNVVVSVIDLDQLLHGSCTPEEVSAFFKDGEFFEEHYLVSAVERHLLTEVQRKTMFDFHLTLEKMFNGRYGSQEEATVFEIFEQWNTKLGHKHFGY